MVADAEHFTIDLLDKVKATQGRTLSPLGADARPAEPAKETAAGAVPRSVSTGKAAGYATAKLPYTPRNSRTGPFYQYVQRQAERPEDYHFKAFLSTTDRDEVEALTDDFPKRWHVEEFFNAHQALGWDRAGTCNLNIRYGQHYHGVIAPVSAIDQLRKCCRRCLLKVGTRSTWQRLTFSGWKETCESTAIRSS